MLEEEALVGGLGGSFCEERFSLVLFRGKNIKKIEEKVWVERDKANQGAVNIYSGKSRREGGGGETMPTFSFSL